MRFLARNYVGLVLLGITLGLLFAASLLLVSALRDDDDGFRPRRGASEEVFTVNVLRALPEDVIPVMTVFGQVQSQRTLEIRAAVGGTIIELSPDFVEGGNVSEGQVLARIDPSESQAALDRAKADLLDAQAEVRDSARALAIVRDELLAAQDQAKLRQTALERQQDLLLRRAGTQTAVEQAEIAVSSARAAVLAKRQAVAQAEARVDQAKTRLARQNIVVSEAQRRLDNTQIRAGFDGTLTAVNVVEGRLVSINEQLAQLIDGNALEVTFRVSTAQFSRLIDQQGVLRPARATISLDVFGTNLEATGSLSRVSASVGAGETGREIFAQLDAAAGLKPGDFVTVSVEEALLRGVVRLPSSAMDAAQEVLVVGEDSRLEILKVDLLRRQGDDILVRGEGLAGRQVVVERSPAYGKGVWVDPVVRQEESVATLLEAPEMVPLTEQERADFIARVEANTRMPARVQSDMLRQLREPEVSKALVDRLRSGQRGGGGRP